MISDIAVVDVVDWAAREDIKNVKRKVRLSIGRDDEAKQQMSEVF